MGRGARGRYVPHEDADEDGPHSDGELLMTELGAGVGLEPASSSSASGAAAPALLAAGPAGAASPHSDVADADDDGDNGGGGGAHVRSVDVTIGGRGGHVLRRVYHVVMFLLVPWVWYWHGDGLAAWLGTRPDRLLGFAGITCLVLEAARIWRRFVCIGCRTYEAAQVSAMAWGASGTVLVLMAAPGRGDSAADRAYVAAPIFWCLGLVDPLLGELKAAGHGLRRRSIAACLVATAVWAVSTAALAPDSGFAWFMVPVMGPLAVLSEYPSIPSVDDNGLMLLIPLAVATMLHPWAD